MNPLHVIGDPETVLAFALGGVPGDAVHSAAEARAAVDTLAGAVRDAGGPVRAPILILMTGAVAAGIRAYLDALVLDAAAPLILEIPGFAEPSGRYGGDRFVERVLRVQT